MKTLIIPVDFSETSLNAARYAADMLAGKPETRVILYNLFDDDDDSDTSQEYLESLQAELVSKGLPKTEIVKEEGSDLIESLSRLAYQKAATLIVMGITGRSALAQAIIGSNTIKMVDRNVCPVMIIPPDATFSGIKNVAFASDFRHKEDPNTILFIKSILEMFRPFLHIVNFDKDHYVSLTEEYEAGRSDLAATFSDYDVEFYFIKWDNFQDAITQFAVDKSIDTIVTVPRSHNAWSGMFKASHTKKLAYHSHVPVIAVHE